MRVNRQIVGFKKIKFYTMENVGRGKLSMPEQEMHTTAFWLHFPAAFLARLADFTPTEKQSGIVGLGNALRTVAALLLMCDPRDLGVALSEDVAGSLAVFEPNLYLYDMYPGGVGQSAPLYRLAPQLLKQTAELLAPAPAKPVAPPAPAPKAKSARGAKKPPQPSCNCWDRPADQPVPVGPLVICPELVACPRSSVVRGR